MLRASESFSVCDGILMPEKLYLSHELVDWIAVFNILSVFGLISCCSSTFVRAIQGKGVRQRTTFCHLCESGNSDSLSVLAMAMNDADFGARKYRTGAIKVKFEPCTFRNSERWFLL